MRAHARTCSKKCRQALQRFGGAQRAASRPPERATFPEPAVRVASSKAAPSSLEENRACAWCFGSVDARRRQARTCGKQCRQALARYESAIAPRDALHARVARGVPQLRPIAALFVQKRGRYFGLPNVDPWDEQRDARRYDGAHPVVAHPPCSRWCRLAGLVEARWGHRKGDDGGCFASALAHVRRCGGVLEHPAYSDAWPAFELRAPDRFGGWSRSPCGGYVCHVEQGRYGHAAKKATWLYSWGVPLARLPDLRWGYQHDSQARALVSWCANLFDDDRPRLSKKAASRTPLTFRAELITIARAVDLDAFCEDLRDASRRGAHDAAAHDASTSTTSGATPAERDGFAGEHDGTGSMRPAQLHHEAAPEALESVALASSKVSRSRRRWPHASDVDAGRIGS